MNTYEESHLEDWTMLGEVEMGGVLTGKVYNRTGIPDGTIVMTSQVQALDLERKIAFTLHTRYTLGKENK